MNLSSLSRSLVALVLLTAPALAGSSTYVDTFSGGVNEGGWTYGPPPTISGPGGNPDAFMSSLVDTFAPQLRTSGASDFTGDYRSRNVVSLGVDLKTFATQFPAARECTLMLSNGVVPFICWASSKSPSLVRAGSLSTSASTRTARFFQLAGRSTVSVTIRTRPGIQ